MRAEGRESREHRGRGSAECREEPAYGHQLLLPLLPGGGWGPRNSRYPELAHIVKAQHIHDLTALPPRDGGIQN